MGSQLPSVGLSVPVDHKAGAAYPVPMGENVAPSDNRALLGLVAFIVFIDMMGIGLIMPVMPTLIMGIAKVSVDRAAEIGGLLFFAYAFMQFLFAPVIGGLSDRFGRRPVLLLTLTALGIDYAFMAWAPTLIWLFVGRIIAGVMGATWGAANSCIADIVEPEKRGAVFGMMGGAGAAGFVFGPVIGGLAGTYSDRLPFLIACALSLGGALVGWFILRETLPQDRRRHFDLARANPFGALLQMMKTPLVMGCLLTVFFMQLSAQSNISIWGYYGALQFGWGPLAIGLTVALYGTMIAVTQGLFVGKAIARFGAVATARWSLFFGLPSYLILAFAQTTWHTIAAILIGTVTALTFPAMQELMSKRISEDAQGELQGAIASTVSLTSIIGPIMMTSIFGMFADNQGLYLPGAPFILALLLLAVSIAILWRTLSRHAVIG
jgi:MFS transporter, DHA1 family, tetracycline resistance protein